VKSNNALTTTSGLRDWCLHWSGKPTLITPEPQNYSPHPMKTHKSLRVKSHEKMKLLERQLQIGLYGK
jgi:hypothetical protein